jgi:hypothetical protein
MKENIDNNKISLVTQRDLNGDNPLWPHSPYFEEFVLLNMHPDGIWLVDKKHPFFERIKFVAITVAKTYGDLEMVNKLSLM